MRIAAQRKAGSTQLEEGTVIRGYEVGVVVDDHVSPEVRYPVRGRHGEEATLVIAREAATDHERERIRRLGERRLRLAHPAAIAAHAYGEHRGHPYLITEAYPATTFGDLLGGDAPLGPDRLLALLAPVADALDSAHSRGLVHQRLEPDNLLLDDDGRLALDSFGLLVAGEGPAWNGSQSADFRYRPPEQALGEAARPESNVYSLAAMIVHALTCEPPFGGDRAAATYAHAMEAPPRVTDRVAGLPGEIDDVIAWGMAKPPGARPRSATELLRAAEAALGTHAVSDALGPAPAPSVPRVAPPVHLAPPRAEPGAPPRRWAGPLAAVAVAAACGAIAALALDPLGGDAEPAAPPRSPETALWRGVADRRADLREELAAAATPQEQASAARELAGVYDAAAESARPSRLTGAARSAAAAYLALAEAAAAGDEAAYADAGEAATAAERRIASAPR